MSPLTQDAKPIIEDFKSAKQEKLNSLKRESEQLLNDIKGNNFAESEIDYKSKMYSYLYRSKTIEKIVFINYSFVRTSFFKATGVGGG